MTCIEELLVAERVVMAPMAGVTDRPFRDLCRTFGAQLMVSEMLTSDVRLYGTAKSRARLGYQDEPGHRWVQIAGAEAKMMSEAAAANADRGAHTIDINMGCPAKKVCNKAAGSALLRDESLVAEILASVVAAVDIPVTLKIRLGWCQQTINATRIARIAEEAGVSALTVHGRTRACRFGGQANYDEIARVVAATRLPVVANGDITSAHRAKQVLNETGAAAVMIGRAAQGRPWLIGQIRDYLATGECKADPEIAHVMPFLIGHVAALHDLYGHHRVARKHIGWFLEAKALTPAKKAFNQLESVAEQLAFLASLEDRIATLDTRKAA